MSAIAAPNNPVYTPNPVYHGGIEQDVRRPSTDTAAYLVVSADGPTSPRPGAVDVVSAAKTAKKGDRRTLCYAVTAAVAVAIVIAIVVAVSVGGAAGDEEPADAASDGSAATAAPLTLSPPGVLEARNHLVALSRPDELLTVVKRPAAAAASSRWPVPCARSYASYPWEAVAPRVGPAADLVQVHSCTATTCQITIPAGDPGHTYFLDSRQTSAQLLTHAAAQLLTQGTFGATRSDVDRLGRQLQASGGSTTAAAAWVRDQLDAPPTLHREYLRRRANGRLEAVSEVGRPRGACEPNSRWNRIAVRADDMGEILSFSAVMAPGGGTVTALHVGGVLRSEVNMSSIRPYGLGAPINRATADDNCNWCQSGGLALDTEYYICNIEEWEMGKVVIGTGGCDGSMSPGGFPERVEFFNTFMQFQELPYPGTDRFGQPIETLALSEGEATLHMFPPTEFNRGALVIAQLGVACPFSYGAQLRPSTTLTYNGEHYRYDPRIVLVDNTLASPADFGSTADTGHSRICPLVSIDASRQQPGIGAPKSFLNEDTCVIGRGCTPDAYSNTSFELNVATLRQFFLSGNNFVYAIDSLRVGDTDPCTQRARWRSLGGPCGGTATTLDASTQTVLAEAIRSSADTNPLVKDVQLTTEDEQGLCIGSVSANAAIIDVDGECWVHTHDDQLNVYDFSLWSRAHEGNRATAGFLPISKVAHDGSAILNFPASHAMDRWQSHANGIWKAVGEPFGRLGDSVTFADLLPNVRSRGFAEAMGVLVTAAQGAPAVETCGSPGEVANDPSLGARFYFGKERYWTGGQAGNQDILKPHRTRFGDVKQVIHTEIALHAPDQLRQKVAWALSETWVISQFSSEVLGDHTEVWASYYDIFVRHAFGSYRDIMKEVSFNPIMGKYLTFENSGSWAYKNAVPDENYAREIMQLFTVGLWNVEQDGTPQLDAAGNLISSYTNADIVELARTWTGFVSPLLRGNIEIKRISLGNQLDPMRIRPERRDIFPKMNLHKGHLGDGYPLCTDLAPQSFLRAGAKFRYLGLVGHPQLGNGRNHDYFTAPRDNQPLFTPDPDASLLFAALCNASPVTGKCRLQSTVVLARHLPCDGDECTLDTMRVVKVAHGDVAYYYEYVPMACVSLAFFAGPGEGRYIENVSPFASNGNDDGLIERLCADPRAAVAAPGCCTPHSSVCFEYDCAFVEERVPLQTALQRCGAKQWPPSPPTSPPPAANGSWYIHPHVYRSDDAAECPAGSSMPAQEECMAAAAAALATAGEPHFDTPRDNTLRVIANGAVPSGCVVSTGNRAVFFNTALNGSSRVNYKLVCDSPEGAASYSQASPLLCSRKRQPCWWDNRGTDNCQAGFTHNADTLLTTNMYWWTEDPCSLNAQVNIDGRVSVVHPGGESIRRTGINSENWFRVRWRDGNFPTATSGCASSCTVVVGESGNTCLCEIGMSKSAAFTDTSRVPSQAEVEEALHIGAPAPGHFDAGVYTRCGTAACDSNSDVAVYTRGTAAAPRFDETAIFAIVVNQTRTQHFANLQSVVTISGAAFSFRNPPMIMTLVDTTVRDALYETDALLDHLLYHQNTAPFVAKMLIQRLVSSNPSPRYVGAVATAFRTGTYAGYTGSGQYGDLGAATVAVLEDREARSPILAADPTHGRIREPLVKVLHMLRAMEFGSNDHAEVELHKDMVVYLGQAVYRSPSVFSFFRPEFSPEGPVQSSGLVAPEAQLSILPFMIGYLDGMSSLAYDGLSQCNGGFGSQGCGRYDYAAAWATNVSNHGFLRFVPTHPLSTNDVIDELDLLLTAGRLDDYSRAVITEAYDHALNLSSCPIDRSIELCGRLVVGDTLSPGEHITNANGEVLCMTYDGVARHIDAAGNEVFSSYKTRGDRELALLTYYSDGSLGISGNLSHGFHYKKWSSDAYAPGHTRVFHSFLQGPCMVIDSVAYERKYLHGYAEHGGVTELITCDAVSSCNATIPPPPPPGPGYMATRAATDAQSALRVAQTLFAASAAFATTNDPSTSQTDAFLAPPRQPSGASYKALVVLFMAGGADTFNLLIPHSGCDERNVAEQYTQTRGVAALPLNALKQILVPAGTQPCDTMGLHPNFNTLQQLYNDGDASMIANVGALVEPITKQQYVDLDGRLPAALFSHNHQTTGAKTLMPQTTTGESGILGRILTAFDAQAAAVGTTPIKTAAYSITSDRTMFRGSPVEPVLLSSTAGMLTYDGASNGDKAESLADFERLARKEAGSIFAATHNKVLQASLRDSAHISTLLENATLTQNWGNYRAQVSNGGRTIVEQFEQVSRVIASRNAFEAERDVFYVEMPHFDSHAKLDDQTGEKFNDIDKAVAAFTAEMKALGTWDQVAVQSLSEFGRTMTTNGQGTDHAWGGNHFLLGGGVRGGVIHGEFPELSIDSSQSISSTGAMLPSSPWEAIWKPLALWFGVQENQLNAVMPNLREFTADSTLSLDQVFTS